MGFIFKVYAVVVMVILCQVINSAAAPGYCEFTNLFQRIYIFVWYISYSLCFLSHNCCDIFFSQGIPGTVQELHPEVHDLLAGLPKTTEMLFALNVVRQTIMNIHEVGGKRATVVLIKNLLFIFLQLHT